MGKAQSTNQSESSPLRLKRPILDCIGRKLVEGDAKGQGRFWRKPHTLPLYHNALRPAVGYAERLQGIVDNIIKSGTFPFFPGEQIVRPGKRQQSGFYGLM